MLLADRTARQPGEGCVSAGRSAAAPPWGGPVQKALRGLVLATSMVILAGCSFTGNTFQPSGLDRVAVGRTTLPQATDDLGAQPVDVWRQGDGSVLARWAYRATVATDAVYFRQEVWLRFAADGTFERQENAINIPLPYRPRTADEADRAAAGPGGSPGPQVLPVAAPPPVQPAAPDAVPAAAPGPADPTLNTTLLPAGTQVIPGPAYPLNGTGR